MIFKEANLKGAYTIEMEPITDARGFFARLFCQAEFQEAGLNNKIAQSSISFNRQRGTLRGMHYQIAPHEEAKVVCCLRGALYDVIIDLRPDSPTFRQWAAFELSAENRRMLYVPENFAHGFQTLEDNTEVLYQISEFYHPESARGIRWDDPIIAIEWPGVEKRIISSKDSGYPLLEAR